MKQAYDAIKWNWQNLDDIVKFGTEVIDLGCVPTTKGGIEGWPLQAKTEEGNKVLQFGDWLIRCEDGTYYVRPTVTVTMKELPSQPSLTEQPEKPPQDPPRPAIMIPAKYCPRCSPDTYKTNMGVNRRYKIRCEKCGGVWDWKHLTGYVFIEDKPTTTEQPVVEGIKDLAKKILLKHYGRPNQPFTEVQTRLNKHILAAMEEMYYAAPQPPVSDAVEFFDWAIGFRKREYEKCTGDKEQFKRLAALTTEETYIIFKSSKQTVK